MRPHCCHFLAILLSLAPVRAAEADADAPLPAPAWANLQWPHTLAHTVSATNATESVYGQVWIEGVTSKPGPTAKLIAQLGYGPEGADPRTSTNWNWVAATFNLDVGNNDEFTAKLLPESPGKYDYLFRYSVDGGKNWLFADSKGFLTEGQAPPGPGKLAVNPATDTNRPRIPGGLVLAGSSTNEIRLGWNTLLRDPTLHGYEVLRAPASGGAYAKLGLTTTNSWVDSTVQSGETYTYVVRSVDTSFNRSGNSLDLLATAVPSVSVTFRVTVPESTDTAGKQVYLAGTLAQLNSSLPDWDPGVVMLTRINPKEWSITLSGKPGTEINYKYALGAWENVEKDADCAEITDRQIKLGAAVPGPQIVSDTVQKWRNIAPCAD
jgi:hypothetical protein